MSNRKDKNRRHESDTSLPPTTCFGLLDCSAFLAPNEYSGRILGLFACFLCKSIGDINFSDIFSKVLGFIVSGQAVDILELLRAARKALPENDASIEKCLILNRLITWIDENKESFINMIYEIQAEMIAQLTDNQQNQLISYPADFRQREKDFYERINAQNRRRFSFYAPAEAKAPSLIYLQNRTTEHLTYLVDSKMRYDRLFRDDALRELDRMFSTSFMINNQPHSGVNPVLVSKRKDPGIYTAKASVTIVSLLHDFMQTHPNMIELCDIELALCPASSDYRLVEPQKLVWKICELRITPNERPLMVQYAELTEITIQQTSTDDKIIHFSDKLHLFTFSISLRLNLKEHRFSKIYQIQLQSLPFAISSHNSHLAYSLTKVIISDIQQFAQSRATDVQVIMDFVLRYFMHRTGVEPKHDLRLYLEQELMRAKANKPKTQSLEEIYFDFLMLFISQVDFMGKHPILAMFYADELFLGPCNSKRAEEIIRQPSNTNSPIVGLRYNSIKVDYQPSSSTATTPKSMKAPPCYVRVDINNDRRDNFENRTFDDGSLSNDILKFVSTANQTNANSVHVLSNFGSGNNVKTYKYFTKYYHEHLHQIVETNSDYQLLIDLMVHVKNNDPSNGDAMNRSRNTSREDSPTSAIITNHTNVSNGTNGHLPAHDAQPVFIDPLNQQRYLLTNDQDVIQYVLSNPRVLAEISRQFRQMRALSAMASAQQQLLPPSNSTRTQPYQSMNANSHQYVPEIVAQRPLHQYPRSTPYISMSTDSSSSSNSLSDQLNSIDLISSQPTNADNQSYLDELFPPEGTH